MKKIGLAYLVDDDNISNYLTGKILENVEFCDRLEIFSDAQNALEALKTAIDTGNNIPEAILFDLNMPEMDGWGFIESFTKLPLKVKIPTFIFTSSIDPADREKSERYEVIKDFITKPLTIIKLDKILRLIDDARIESKTPN
jgi:CheY-like chemotaxis protein